MLLIDTNVQLDLTSNNRKWSDWSLAKLKLAATRGPLLINDVVYAELSVGFGGLKIWIDFLDDTRVKFAPTPRPALLQAAKTIRQYRKNGGNKTGVLTDFFVGAHAVVENLPLLTRAPRRLSYLF